MVVSMGAFAGGRPMVKPAGVRPVVAAPVRAQAARAAAPSAPRLAVPTRPAVIVAPKAVPTTTPKVVISPLAVESSAPSLSASSSSSSSSAAPIRTSEDFQVIDVPGYAISAGGESPSALDVERGVPAFRVEEEEIVADVKPAAAVAPKAAASKVPTWVFAAGGALVVGALAFVALKGSR